VPLNIEKEVAVMNRMTVNELRERFAIVFGEHTNGRNKQWLIKWIAWRLQANAEGGLSERARQRAREFANEADLRLTAPRNQDVVLPKNHRPTARPDSLDPRLPSPGTLLTRQYKGRTLQVEVLRDGFAFEGERYRSLSAIAATVTGSRWNGFLFFGLTQGAK
jgi:hypothetical protein